MTRSSGFKNHHRIAVFLAVVDKAPDPLCIRGGRRHNGAVKMPVGIFRRVIGGECFDLFPGHRYDTLALAPVR